MPRGIYPRSEQQIAALRARTANATEAKAAKRAAGSLSPYRTRICRNCQRCKSHCFREPECSLRFTGEICLTCSGAVFYVVGKDPSLAIAVQRRETNREKRGKPARHAAISASGTIRP